MHGGVPERLSAVRVGGAAREHLVQCRFGIERDVRAEDALGPEVTVEERLAFFANRSPRSRQGRVLYAEALLAADRKPEAATLLRASWVADDFGDDDAAAFVARYGWALQPSDESARLDRLLWDRRTDQARRMLARVADPQRAVATARLKLQLADPTVDAAIAAVPASLRRDPGLLYDRLRWRRLQGNDAGVREILLDLPPELGQPELWWREQEPAIRAAITDRAYKLAYRLAGASSQRRGAPFLDSAWLAGWLGLQFTGTGSARVFAKLLRPRQRPVTNVVAMIVVLMTFLPILAAYYLTRDGDQVSGMGK